MYNAHEIGEQFITLVRKFPIGTPVYKNNGVVGTVDGYYRTTAQDFASGIGKTVFCVSVKVVSSDCKPDMQTSHLFEPHQLYT